jgi:hypothetical protein
MTAMNNLPSVVSRNEWFVARRELLIKEKELTRALDRLAAERRRLPMVLVDKPYIFNGPNGPVALLDLFEGREQLVMHHFMFGPDWEQPCPSCSSAADGIGNLRQLHVRNTTVVAVSRAPYAKLAIFRERLRWTFPWYSGDRRKRIAEYVKENRSGELPARSGLGGTGRRRHDRAQNRTEGLTRARCSTPDIGWLRYADGGVISSGIAVGPRRNESPFWRAPLRPVVLLERFVRGR